MVKSLLIALMAVFAAGLPAQEAEEEQLSYIEGVVVDQASKAPIPRALVTASLVGSSESVLTRTDPSGRFRIRGLEAGDYSLGIEKRGYLRYSYGSLPGAWSRAYLSVKRGFPVEDLRLEMRRPGVLTGCVTDENGEPFADSQVEVRCVAPIEDEFSCSTGGQTKADDRGVFRIYNLRPGRYVISAKPQSRNSGILHHQPSLNDPDGRLLDMGYLKTYYPYAFDRSQAGLVDVHCGSETSGIEIRLDVVKTLGVSGQVITPSKPKNAHTNVSLQSLSKGEYQDSHNQSYQDREGGFAFDGLAPSEYVLIAEYKDGGARVVDSLRFELTDTPLRGIELRPRHGVTVRGRVSFDDRDVKPDELMIYVSVRQEGALESVTKRGEQADLDGSFAIHGVLPGTYRFSAAVYGAAGVNYYTDAVFVDAKPIAEEGLLVSEGTGIQGIEVRVARTVSLRAVVLGQDLEPIPGAIVVLSASQGDFSDPVTALANGEGRFRIHGVIPGERMLFAFPQGTSGAQITPELLRTVKSHGHEIEVKKESTEEVELSLIERLDR